ADWRRLPPAWDRGDGGSWIVHPRGQRPLVDASEMIVVAGPRLAAIAGARPQMSAHRQVVADQERVDVALHAALDLADSLHQMRALAQAEGAEGEGRRPEADLDVDEAGGIAARHVGERPSPGHGGFEQELRRLETSHVLGRGHAAGLEIEDFEQAVGALVDEVGLAGQNEVFEL